MNPNEEPVEDNFYPEIRETVKPLYKRKSGRVRRSDGPFDRPHTGSRKARSNNRGVNRFIRKIRRHEDFRMKLLWTFAALLMLAILAYALMQDLKYRRVERMSDEEQAAWHKAQAEARSASAANE